VAAGESDEHFSGVIVGVGPTGPKHIEVTLDILRVVGSAVPF
jgi:hypothetical protein